MTDRTFSSDAVRDTHAELARARLTTMGELTASLAHELSQPLTAIINNAESCLRWLSKEHADVERARRAAQRVITTAREASDIVQNIRAMLSKSTPQFGHVDLNEAITRTVALMRGQIRSRGVSIALELCPDIPRVLGDRVQLQQVLVNLITNAIQAMSDQPRRLLRITTQRTESGSALTSVEDSGGGLDSAWAERIFEPFFTTKPQGMGLGLALCASIISAHRGRLSVSQRAPHGCIFQFELPEPEKT